MDRIIRNPVRKESFEAAGNYHFGEDVVEAVGAREQFRRNVNAIRVLKSCEYLERSATLEEQKILSMYAGWGGIPDAFDENKEGWTKEYQELKALINEDEYEAARASTLNAHFTSPMIIRAIYKKIEEMGFQKGNILEPAMGTGNFFGAASGVYDRSQALRCRVGQLNWTDCPASLSESRDPD